MSGARSPSRHPLDPAAALRSGLLVEAEFPDPAQRKSRTGVRAEDARRPSLRDIANERIDR